MVAVVTTNNDVTLVVAGIMDVAIVEFIIGRISVTELVLKVGGAGIVEVNGAAVVAVVDVLDGIVAVMVVGRASLFQKSSSLLTRS